MYRALYRSWRPQTFDDVCGQKQITDILKYQVAEGKISHAYLFCGSRGTGKTTCAKILAKAVNCLQPVNGNPCNTCEACRAINAGNATDVIEMDAASNNGVDNIRDLKEEIIYMPAEMKYRVYIIDEVHMMSPSAFNALLKTLEEPPSYVLFILATTELAKLPSTIVSRCQRCDFRRISTDVISARLSKIATAEGMDLTDNGARVIARAAQGGMRDAVSLLELCGGAHTTIDEALVVDILGAGDRATLYRVAEAIADKDYPLLYQTIDNIVMSSGDLAGFWNSLGDVIRDIIVYKTTPTAKEYLDLTDAEDERVRALASRMQMSQLFYIGNLIAQTLPSLQKTGVSRRATAEIALTRMCDAQLSTTAEAMSARIEELEREVKLLRLGVGAPAKDVAARVPEQSKNSNAEMPAETSKPIEDKPVKSKRVKEETTAEKEPEKTAEKEPEKTTEKEAENIDAARTSATNSIPESKWRQITEELVGLYPWYTGLFDGSSATLDDDMLKIALNDNFMITRLEQDNNAKQVLTSLATQATQTNVTKIDIVKIKSSKQKIVKDDSIF